MVTSSVSVALCTRNGERYIGEQLASILDQSLQPTQIVLSDDASTDQTVSKARAIIARHRAERPSSQVQFILVENAVALGVTKNFEQALGRCTGDLIALSDQDDVWAPTRIERAVAVFAVRPQLLLVHSDALLIDDAGRGLGSTLLEALEVSDSARAALHDGRAFEELMRRNLVTGATSMINRDLLRWAVPFPAPWVHDEWLAIVAAAANQLDFLPESLVSYRQHSTNEIGARRLSVVGKFRRLMEPGAQRNKTLLERAVVLAERIGQLGVTVSEARQQAAVQKLAHERARMALPSNRLRRFFPVLAELLTGRYSSFGRGPADAARDLLQPLEGDR